MINLLFKTGLLEKTLDASVLRNDAISQNLSNVDTPNYKRKQVKFEEILTSELEKTSLKGNRTNDRHIPIGEALFDSITPEITEDGSSSEMRLDGNNVDVNQEMADMAKNNLKFEAVIQRLSGQFKTIRSVLNEGRR